MSRFARWLGPGLFLVILLAGGRAAVAQVAAAAALPPYKMVRTLEFVQDSIVNGDHAAMAMQRYLLTAIDDRLRHADAAVFDDPRNVDAALIYAMSGGNPDTFSMLAARDVDGRFDHRLTEALGAYFSGRPETAAEELRKAEPEFRDSTIGPYLTLVTANAIAHGDPKAALELFDWVRLLAPGTILEESALRRSISVASRAHMIAAGLVYAEAYARRFLHSPYAGQFADLFVGLVVDNDDKIGEDDVLAILTGMDEARQKEIFLRIARRAAIAGKTKLAEDAAGRAEKLAVSGDAVAGALADLYGGIASIPSANVDDAIAAIAAIPDASLSYRDRMLRHAAIAVGKAVIRPPRPGGEGADGADVSGRSIAANDSPPSLTPIPSKPRQVADTRIDPAQLGTFIGKRRAKLKEIDALLKGTVK